MSEENSIIKGLVSLIMPAYNTGNFIHDAILSVTRQSYTNWELFVVDDGSTDDTARIVTSFKDVRVKYHYQSNRGVSAARNIGLKHMSGEFFCFLDSDDLLPPESLKSRLEMFFADPSLDFVDGVVVYLSEDLQEELRRYTPSFRGKPYEQLLRLNSACLFGNTWMIRRKQSISYNFKEQLTHGEDLYFYITIAKAGGYYSFTEKEILWYRQRNSSAMKDLSGLEKGYQSIYRLVKKELGASKIQLLYLKCRITRIMFASYLVGQRNLNDALRSLIRNISI